MRDYYRVLGIDRNAPASEIKAAYKKLALRYHPDRVPEGRKKQAETKFKEIANAYQVLGNIQKRKDYDLSAGDPFAGRREYATDGSAAGTVYGFQDKQGFRNGRCGRRRGKCRFGSRKAFKDDTDILSVIRELFGSSFS